jgi:hypothetical protein
MPVTESERDAVVEESRRRTVKALATFNSTAPLLASAFRSNCISAPFQSFGSKPDQIRASYRGHRFALSNHAGTDEVADHIVGKNPDDGDDGSRFEDASRDDLLLA